MEFFAIIKMPKKVFLYHVHKFSNFFKKFKKIEEFSRIKNIIIKKCLDYM